MSSLKINNLNEAQAHQALEHCCAAPNWVSGMLNIMPFENKEHLFNSAQSVWDSLGESDYLAAFFSFSAAITVSATFCGHGA